jgi:purine-binding chemotaxis protein CheW
MPETDNATNGATRQLVVFSLGEEQYALPIETVSEIIRHTRARTIVTDDPWVRGVISLRGKIVPIFDLAARLQLAGVPEAETDKIIVVETATGHVGVTVQEVEEVLTIAEDQLEPVPAGGDQDGLDGIVKLGDRLVILLDPATLLASTELEPAAG